MESLPHTHKIEYHKISQYLFKMGWGKKGEDGKLTASLRKQETGGSKLLALSLAMALLSC